MFSNSALLVTLAFAIFAAAVPVLKGVSIPQPEKAILSTIRQDVFNDFDDDALPEGAEIFPVDKIRDNLLRMLEYQSESDKENDVEWAGDIYIGTPGKTLIDFDTGPSDFWAPSSSCKSSAWFSKSRCAGKSSSASQTESGSFYIKYADGSSASGPVTVVGITKESSSDSPITTLSIDFTYDPTDGFPGMAFPAIFNLKNDPSFNTAFSLGAVAIDSFGFKLATSGSEFYLGGANSNLYTDPIESHSISSSAAGFWQVQSDVSVYVNGNRVVSGFDAIINSGTTIMYGPSDAVSKFYSSIPGSILFDPSCGYYSFPCNSVPSVSFNWGGKDWAISSSNFNLGETQEGSGQCIGALAEQDSRFGNVWNLGDTSNFLLAS